jgi:two-component system, cell cycle response regulator DivK
LPEARGVRPLVLLVHNYQDSREMYAHQLLLCGFGVAEASNGRHGLEQSVELLPDAILLDAFLPGLDGWEAARRLRADPRTCHIPTIVLTSQRPEDMPREAPDLVLMKPCLPETLVVELNRLIADRSRLVYDGPPLEATHSNSSRNRAARS